MKVLVLGPASESNEAAWIAKVQSLTKKQTFDLLLVMGIIPNVKTFTDAITVPTYFISSEQCDDTQLYLGDHGILNTAEGLAIAYYSKTENSQASSDFLKSSEKNGFRCDLLLSTHWPKGITLGSDIASTKNISDLGSSNVSQAVTALTPKYHFASGNDMFFEREPYTNSNGKITRFIGIANFGNKAKERWFYAINIDPNDSSSVSTTSVTACPYVDLSKRSYPDDKGNFSGEGQRQKKIKGPPPDGYECRICSKSGHWIQDCPEKKRDLPDGYICKICSVPGHFIRDCPQAKKKDKAMKKLGRDFSQCWFCLSNPSLEKHLIVSIGEETYLAVAKGGVVDWGGHLLIVPVGHFESYKHLIHSDSSGEIRKEMFEMKAQVSKMYWKRDEVLVSFEIFGGFQGQSAPMQHFHFQLLPVHSDLELEVEPSFRREAEAHGFIVTQEKDVELLALAYCKVEIFSNGKHISTFIFTPSEQKLQEFRFIEEEASNGRKRPPRLIDPQFGRTVIANLLGYPEKSDWKYCIQTEEEEKAMAAHIKALYESR